ncbi:MAG: hypothetical protein WBP55_09965 [Solirubrobacterales bacterium]
MSQVDVLFRQFVTAWESGASDPRPYLSKVDGLDREELSTLINNFLDTASGRAWDPEAFAGSPAASLVDPLAKSLAGGSGTWPSLLPELRHRAKIKRSELVDRLAEALGVQGSEELVGEYYHGMEQGTVESAGVSRQVLNALSRILHTKAETLLEAGQAISGKDSPGQQPTFARLSPAATPLESRSIESVESMSSADEQTPAGDQTKSDEIVDQLFTGGR